MRRAPASVFMTAFALGVALISGAGTTTLAQTTAIAIVGGTVHPVSGPRIERGTVLIRDGRIAAVGADVTVPADAQRLDATGKWVTPGLINVVSVLGLVEIQLSGGATDERALGRNNIAAAFRPWDAFDSASPLITATRNDGITTIGLMPAGNLVSGQHALVDLANGPGAAMVRRAPSAMVVRVQEASPAGTASRGELLAKLRTLLTEARDWPGLRGPFGENRTGPLLATAADYEALQPVMTDFKVRVILVSASEAWQRAPELAAAGVPVVVGGIRNIPDSFDRLNTRDDNAALLRRAGVTVTLQSDSYGDGNHFNVRNIRFEAGNAAGNGMTWDDALRAVTAVPAEVFGVGDRIGALRPDMDANVVVWSGDPFEFSTRAEAVFIRGTRVDTPGRQDQLMERYRPVR
jgi:imidazolonepropionase-like amidohydrolase